MISSENRDRPLGLARSEAIPDSFAESVVKRRFADILARKDEL
jgi:hypothetical protein